MAVGLHSHSCHRSHQGFHPCLRPCLCPHARPRHRCYLATISTAAAVIDMVIGDATVVFAVTVVSATATVVSAAAAVCMPAPTLTGPLVCVCPLCALPLLSVIQVPVKE